MSLSLAISYLAYLVGWSNVSVFLRLCGCCLSAKKCQNFKYWSSRQEGFPHLEHIQNKISYFLFLNLGLVSDLASLYTYLTIFVNRLTRNLFVQIKIYRVLITLALGSRKYFFLFLVLDQTSFVVSYDLYGTFFSVILFVLNLFAFQSQLFKIFYGNRIHNHHFQRKSLFFFFFFF